MGSVLLGVGEGDGCDDGGGGGVVVGGGVVTGVVLLVGPDGFPVSEGGFDDGELLPVPVFVGGGVALDGEEDGGGSSVGLALELEPDGGGDVGAEDGVLEGSLLDGGGVVDDMLVFDVGKVGGGGGVAVEFALVGGVEGSRVVVGFWVGVAEGVVVGSSVGVGVLVPCVFAGVVVGGGSVGLPESRVPVGSSVVSVRVGEVSSVVAVEDMASVVGVTEGVFVVSTGSEDMLAGGTPVVESGVTVVEGGPVVVGSGGSVVVG